MSRILQFNKPARGWAEGFMMGNGHMGCVLYGGVEKEIIELSEITFFSGEKSKDNNQKGAAEKFLEMRELVSKNRYKEAEETALGFIGRRQEYGTNLPVGSIVMEFNTPEDEAAQYHRSLDIVEGMVNISYTAGGTSYEREAFLSHPSKQLFYRIKADSSNQINCNIRFEGGENSAAITAEEDKYLFEVKAYEKLHSNGMCGVTLWGEVRVEQIGGSIRYTKDGIIVEGADQMILTLRMSTDFIKDTDYGFHACNIDLPVNYDRERENHRKDFSAIMERVELQLGEDELSALMFQYGRYLLLSSSREDSPLPTHLQGIWNDNVACRIGWTCDMHLDINTQMNYWMAEPANLAECHKPLFRWMEEQLIPSGRITAKESYGLKGWSADLVSNAWGFSAPYWSKNISPCPTGGIWTASDYWEHYEYTQDIEFLKNQAYPVLSEAMDFFIDYVFWDEGSDFYTSGPSISPENCFLIGDDKHYFSNGCTYEILMIRQLFEIFLAVERILELKDKRALKARHILDKLLPYRILEDGSIAEWSHNYSSADSQHRHTSHLLGLFPYSQITPEKTPGLADAAKKTIELKLTPYENWEDTGWARSMLILYSARLKEGEKAYFHMKEMQGHLTHPNLLVMHPPTRGAGSFKEVYELDGNTGFSMGVMELLMQSHEGVIQLLPALPSNWDSGFVKGLIARGGVKVNITWSDNRLIEAGFCTKEDKAITIQYQNQSHELWLPAKERISIRFDTFFV